MITDHNLTELDALVARYFSVENVTYGGPKDPFLIRYRGRMSSDDLSTEFDKLIEHNNKRIRRDGTLVRT